MKYSSFDLQDRSNELTALQRMLKLNPTEGTVRFAGERTLVLGAAALGDLRRHMIATFGASTARTMLMRFGFVHGWRMAGAVQRRYAGAGMQRWREAGGYLHMLQGHLRIDAGSSSPLSEEGCCLSNSYEVEQHLRYFPSSAEPVCWHLCGIASGYLSRIEGQRIYVVEDRCVARGDYACRFHGKTERQWGTAFDARRSFFQVDDLALDEADAEVEHATTELGAAEDRELELVTHSECMRVLLACAELAAATDLPVLIGGESGVGKERLARFIHRRSPRADGPFVAVNCAAIPAALCESELFGHARGAFSGADRERVGLFEASAGGTLMLDEIGDMALVAQAKLLRVLQERTVRRVGENRERPVDVRIIAATKRALHEEVTRRRFREDLYYRLNALDFYVPPLRERPEDLLPLAREALRSNCERLGRTALSLADCAVEAIQGYAWPGNVRELHNVMQRAAVLVVKSPLRAADLKLPHTELDPAMLDRAPRVKPLDVVEREYILSALARNGGNQVRTALQLGIAESTLYRKLKQYGGIVVPRSGASRRNMDSGDGAPSDRGFHQGRE